MVFDEAQQLSNWTYTAVFTNEEENYAHLIKIEIYETAVCVIKYIHWQ